VIVVTMLRGLTATAHVFRLDPGRRLADRARSHSRAMLSFALEAEARPMAR
jgi:hypothetical protein